MANLDLTAMSAALKEYYHGQKVTDLTFKKNPTLALLKKDTKAGGEVIPVPVMYGKSQGRSGDFATAQANQTAPVLAKFMLTRKSDYSLATIDNQTLEATQNDVEAFIKASELHIDAAYHTIVASAASGIFRAGTGTIGQIHADWTDGNDGVFELAEAVQALQFEVGMAITASSGDGSGTVRAGVGYVLAVNVASGSITVSTTRGGAAGEPTAWAALDYLQVQGDYNAKISGFGAWLPIVRTGLATSFYGVNRSLHERRLAGVYHDGSAQSIEEAAIDLSNYTAENGGSGSKLITNYRSYGALKKALGSKVQYVDLETEVGIGFRGIRISGDDGEIDVIPDRNCPARLGYLLDMDTWCLRSVGEVPHIITYGKEGLEMLRVSNQDAAEVRIAYYANLECNDPGANGVVQFGA